MKLYLMVLFAIVMLLPHSYADTPAPVIEFNLVKTITWTATGIGGNQTLFRASTSWDPAPISTITCTDPNCRLQIEDCNGSLAQCNNQTDGRNWAVITLLPSPEYDLTCLLGCTRLGVFEDILFQTRADVLQVGSRWVRACWYDTVLINCSTVQRLHTYDDSSTVPPGVSFCRPLEVGRFQLFNRECTFDQNNGIVPLIVFIDTDLNIFNNGRIILKGANIEFNSTIGVSPLSHQIRFDTNTNTFIKIRDLNKSQFSSYPAFNFDKNQVVFFGYSAN